MKDAFRKLVLFEPRDVPVRGMFSYPDPSSLQIGEWAQLTNVRPKRRALYVRNGYDDLFTMAAGTFRGAGVVQLDSQSNNPFYVAGLNISSKGKIYAGNSGTGIGLKSTDSGTQYGETHFASGTSYFTVAPITGKGAFGLYPSNGICAVQDDSGFPRVYDTSVRVSGTGHTAIHRPISPPTTNTSLKTIPTFPVFFLVNTAAQTSYMNSAVARFGLSESGTDPANDIRLATGGVGSEPQSGDTAQVAFTTAKDLSASRQLVMLIDDQSATLDTDFWSNIKIEIGEGGVYPTGFSTVYDGTAAANNTKVEYQPDVTDNTRYWLAFPIDHIASGSRNAVTQILFTWASGTRTGFAASSMQIMLIAGSGKVGGGCLHGISYFNSGSWAESPGLVIVQSEPEYIKNLGGYSTTTAASAAVQIPDRPEILVNYTIQFQNTDATELGRGVDTLRIYRKDQVYDAETDSWRLEQDWANTEDKVIANWIDDGTPAWELVSGTVSSIRTTSDSVDIYAKDYTLTFPPGTHLPIPVGKVMCAANDRLFVAGYKDSSSDLRDTLWISEKRQTTRFNRRVQWKQGIPDEASASSIRFPGEIIQSVVASSTSVFGQSQIFVITDKATYSLRDPFWFVQKVGDVGTLCPFSVVENRGRVFFVDADMVVRKMEGGEFIDLSSQSIADKLLVVPNAERAFVSGAYYRDSYRLAYAPTAGANVEGLIFDEVFNGWYADTFTTIGAEQFIVWREATGMPKLCFFSAESTPKMYEHEQDGQTDDNGTAIAVTLTSPEIHDEDWNKIYFRKGSAIVDDNASGTLTWTTTYPHTGSTSVATMSIDVSTSQAWRQTAQPTPTGAQGGPSAQVSITGNMIGGKRIKFLAQEVEGLSAGPDR